MTKILVTGASGFIGRYFVQHARANGSDVVTADRASGDIGDDATWRAFPEADVVVHLAGKSYVPASWREPNEFLRSNFLGTVAAIDFCRRHQARLVFLRSYAYAIRTTLPIPESSPLQAINPYALTKQLSEEVCQFFAGHYGVDVTVLRPFNVYGADQGASFLIPSIIRAVENGEEIRVRDLEPRRDYVHVYDVVRAMFAATTGPPGYSVFNIGTGVSHSVAEVIAKIHSAWGTTLSVLSDGERRTNEIMDTVADIHAAELALGWRPRISLADGLAQMRASAAKVA